MIPPPPRALLPVPPLGPLPLCCLLYFFLSHSARPDLTILTDRLPKMRRATPQPARVRPPGQNGSHPRSSACWHGGIPVATDVRPTRPTPDHAFAMLRVWASWQTVPSAVRSAASRGMTGLIPGLEYHATSTGALNVRPVWERGPGRPP